MSGLDWRTPADAMPKDGEAVIVALGRGHTGYDVASWHHNAHHGRVLWYGNHELYSTREIKHWAAFQEAPE